MEVSLLNGPTPRDEAGYELAVAAVWGAKAFPELTFFQRELEGELSQVEGSEQHESPASREQRRTYYQAEVPVVERVTHVAIRSLYHQPLRNAVLLGPGPWGKQGSGEQQPCPSHLCQRPCPCHHRADEEHPAEHSEG